MGKPGVNNQPHGCKAGDKLYVVWGKSSITIRIPAEIITVGVGDAQTVELP